MSQVIVEIERLFQQRGEELYGGEAVSQLEHALQCAALAEKESGDAADIAAALLHDVGHLLEPDAAGSLAENATDARHEHLGQRYLEAHFGPAVTEPVRLHVAAKRYLCSVESNYLETLSDESLRSLRLQGGPMNEAEVAEFAALPHFERAVALRRRDDAAKIVGEVTPSIGHFLPYLEQCFVHR